MFFDRISASFALARSSWDVLRKDKQLLLFPVLSGIGCTLVLLSFVVPIGVIAYVGDGSIRSSRAPPSSWSRRCRLRTTTESAASRCLLGSWPCP